MERVRAAPGIRVRPIYAVQLGDTVRSPGDGGVDLPRRRSASPDLGPPAWATVTSKRSTSCASSKASEPPPPSPRPSHTTLPGQETAARTTEGLAQQVLDLDE
ncbi:hypothetical protein ABZ468_12650 [Streptomyces sp. NPDC005708]|uniref:hypothetical protein n=1 Tax=Streptomyces sp. NPDC005708 TaxID=3154564 RepID=UPI0033D7CC13